MKPVPRAFHALTAEMWAISPDWLPLLSAIAQRNQTTDDIETARAWVKRDLAIMAGPGAQKLPGAHRAFVMGGTGILPITGPIFPRANLLTEMSGATSLSLAHSDHRVMLDSKEVSDIMLLIDSPGGVVSGIANFALHVANGAKRKKTVAYVTGSAASAAYWIASATSWISIDRTAQLGSIGVVAAVPKQVQAGDDGFITVEVVSSNAPNKRVDPQTEDGLNQIRGTLDDLERIFISDVARGRQVPVSKVINEFGKGGVLIGSAAVRVGMADAVETQAAAMNALRLARLSPNGQRMVAQSAEHDRGLRLPAPSEGDREMQVRLNRLRLAGLRR
jgi:ClpP class serine protease